MEKLTGKFSKYDKTSHTAVCPINSRYSSFTEITTKISLLGCAILGEIDMPIDIGIQFIQIHLPEWLKLEENEDIPNEDLHFVDPKGHHRMRVDYNFFNTRAWTRYTPSQFITTDDLMKPSVVDLEKEDDEDEINPCVIWVGSRSPSQTEHDLEIEAKKWLDLNYPNWSDPMAYWT